MPSHDDIPLPDRTPGALDDQEQSPHADAEDRAAHDDASEGFRAETRRTRASVLLGSAILQLPIWGFAMSYGVLQEYYTSHWTLHGDRGVTGVIGTTSNGVMYLSMPFLFALYTRRFARQRRNAALCGAVLASASFLLSSFSTHVAHLVATQSVLASLGCALVYSTTTLSLGEWFSTGNRAVAYGLVFSCKNVVGSTCPFLLQFLLDRCGLRTTLRVWAAVTALTSLPTIFLVPPHPSSIAVVAAPSAADGSRSSGQPHRRPRSIPWHFLRHRTFYVYAVATALQSSGYGIPQTYLGAYAKEAVHLSGASATILLALFNIPGIASSSFFGYLSGERVRRRWLSAASVTALSAGCSALSAWLLWGLAPPQPGGGSGMALLAVFSVTFGFFAGGYSATWAGVISEMEREAAARNEAVDGGVIYGLLNGARGLGYVGGGLAGVPLLNAGAAAAAAGDKLGHFGYGTSYGPLILFTGLSSVFGGWGVLWRR